MAGVWREPLLAATLLFWVFLPAGCTERRLSRLVIVARSSVTNLYPPAEQALDPGVIDFPVSAFSSNPLPDFGVPPGRLTAQGQTLAQHLGAYVAQRYSSLLGALHCADVAVNAAPHSMAAHASAENFAQGLLGPGRCPSIVNQGAAAGFLERLFRRRPDAFDMAQGCNTPSAEELRGILGLSGDATKFRWNQVYRQPLTSMQDRLKCCNREVCDAAQSVGACTLFNLPTTVSSNGTWGSIGGSMGVAAYFAEVFMMQYCNGLEAGWGLREEELSELLSFLEVAQVADANPVSAASLGSELLFEVVRALRPPKVAAVPAVSVYFGDELSIQFLRRLLGLEWLSEGWRPNMVEPGAQLVFEVFDEADGGNTIQVLKMAATPKQQHDAVPLTEKQPPSISELWVPGCKGLQCKLRAFMEVALMAVDANRRCVQGLANSSTEIPVRTQPPAAQGVPQAQAPQVSNGVPGAPHTSGAAVPATSLATPMVAAAPVQASVVVPGTTLDPVLLRTPMPSEQEEASSHSTLLFILTLTVGICAWRFMKKRQQRQRGYESLGGSNMPGFTL